MLLDRDKQRAFLAAVYSDMAEAERLFRKDPQSVHYRDTVGETAFHYLIVENQPDRAAKLLEWGSDINTQTKFGDTPLMSAVRLKYLDLVKWLVARGADLDLKNGIDETALCLATRNESAAIFHFLVAQPRKFPITYYYDSITAHNIVTNRDELVMRDHLISLGLTDPYADEVEAED